MKKGAEDFIVNLIGVIPLVLGILAVFNSFQNGNPSQILWLCYMGMILMGLGIILRKSFLVMSQIYILAIPLLIWDVDFIYYLATKKFLLGITNYFFVNPELNLGKIISLQHLVTIPMSVYAVYLIGLKRKDAWKLSALQIILAFLLVFFLTPPEANINCVFKACVDFSFGAPYQFEWFLASFGMIAFSVFVLNNFFFRKLKFRERFV